MTDHLPGKRIPYFLQSGEGERFLLGGQLATFVARMDDTEGPHEGVVISGGKGSTFPLHAHESGHEMILVLDGRLDFWLDGRQYSLSRDDYANVPPKISHGYRMQGHNTSFLSWTNGGAARLLHSTLGDPWAPHTYPPGLAKGISSERMARAEAGADVKFIQSEPPASSPQAPLSKVPDGVVPFVLESGEGQRLVAGDTLFNIIGQQNNSAGKFLGIMTEGPAGEAIPKHYHDKVMEAFFCVDGCMTLWAGESEYQLQPGDFLNVPAGIVHAYRMDAHFTRFFGYLSPGTFENFFRILGDPSDNYIFPTDIKSPRFDRVAQHLAELDVKFVERPGTTTGARQ
jgi:quercetin 2,3-dioxygenase